MNTFQCRLCKQHLPLNRFYKNTSKENGHDSVCKICDKERSKAYYYAHRNKVIQRHRSYYCSHQEKIRDASREYYKLHRKQCLINDNTYDKANPEKKRCRNITQGAIRRGKIIVGDCDNCKASSNETMIHAHHEDYTQPMMIIWLCASCHSRKHLALKGE